MVSMLELWLPILVSAVAVFFASSIVWMALPIHKKDYKPLGEKENAVRDVIRGLPGGMYMFPFCGSKDRNSPEAKKKLEEGPWGMIMVMPRVWNMGKTLGLWMLNLLILSVLIGYVAGSARAAGASFGSVFQIAATAALLAHGGGVLCDSIWKGRPWSQLPGAVFDAVVYAAVTGAVFAWLWPKATLPSI